MRAILSWLQEKITLSLLGGGITDTHHKNQVARRLRFQEPAASKPSTPEEQIVYRVLAGTAAFYRPE